MIRLYTPGTGFPDLEAKIAYGLAAIGLEVTDEVEIEEYGGRFIVRIGTGNAKAINKAFEMFVRRMLTSTHMFFIPGVQAKYRDVYTTADRHGKLKERLLNYDLLSLYDNRENIPVNFRSDKLCHHEEIPPLGKSDARKTGGLLLAASTHAGKPYKKDSVVTNFNTTLCEVCGYIAIIGLAKFAFQNIVGDKKAYRNIVTIAIPSERLDSSAIKFLMSAQRIVSKKWLTGDISLRTTPFALMAKFPSICYSLKDINTVLHVSAFSPDGRGGFRLDEFTSQSDIPFKKFIGTHPENVATVDRLLGQQPAVSAIDALYECLQSNDWGYASLFARLYSKETSKGNYVNLLYPKTANYLLKEVCMIPEEIIKDEAINALASTLRHFVLERNYGYVDSIRNARYESKDFEETIAKLLREAQIRSDPEHKKYVPIPSDEQIRHIFSIASESEEKFNQVKTALSILAFTWHRSEKVNKEEVS